MRKGVCEDFPVRRRGAAFIVPSTSWQMGGQTAEVRMEDAFSSDSSSLHAGRRNNFDLGSLVDSTPETIRRETGEGSKC